MPRPVMSLNSLPHTHYLRCVYRCPDRQGPKRYECMEPLRCRWLRMQPLEPVPFCGWGCPCRRCGVAKRSACLRHDLSSLFFTVLLRNRTGCRFSKGVALREERKKRQPLLVQIAPRLLTGCRANWSGSAERLSSVVSCDQVPPMVVNEVPTNEVEQAGDERISRQPVRVTSRLVATATFGPLRPFDS